MNDQPKARNTHEHHQAQGYIDVSHQLQQPLGHRPLTAEEAALVLVDEIWKLYATFKHTRSQGDLLRMVARVMYLERLGFHLVIVNEGIYAHRTEAPATWLH